MRISTEKKFIFLARPRTGSTTCRNVVQPHADIIGVHISKITDDFPFYNHIPAVELKQLFEERDMVWSDYKKFCFARNPYDRIVSLYHHNIWMTGKEKTFEYYVNNIVDPKNILTISLENFIGDEDQKNLDVDVLQFEKIYDELAQYLLQFGIKVTAQHVPHLNSSENRGKYREYYTDQLRERIADLYALEIDMFGYTF